MSAQKETQVYEPYDRETASVTDRVAWDICQIFDDDAPLRWARYRVVAECIAHTPELMAELMELKTARSEYGTP